MRDWFWQIKAIGQGPDYVFTATFAPSDAEGLAEMVRRHLPTGFVPRGDFIDAGRRGDCVVYESYVDQHTYKRLMAMRESGVHESVWYHGEIEVRDHQLIIEHVLAGGMYAETDMIVALARAPALTLQEWTVAYSGDAWGEVARGAGAASLLDYLQAEA